MRFLIDNQLPAVLASWLRERGHVAEHVREIGLSRAKDKVIWDYALSRMDALVTKDVDFTSIRLAAGTGPCVVWLRVGNATNDALFAWLEPRYDRIIAAIHAGGTFVDVG